MLPSAIHIPRSNVAPATNRHTATLILFHGSGGCGEDLKDWLDILNRGELRFPHIKIVYPSAPIQPYTVNGGMPSNVWFDRLAISNGVPEVKHSIDLMCNKASEIIKKEVESGIALNRIVIGGFSMGSGLSLQLAYRFQRSLAGCIAMSTFLSDDSLVYESLRSEPSDVLPELLQFHGASDDTVPIEWGQKVFDTLRSLGVKGTFVSLPSAEHELVPSELSHLKNWLLQKLPDDRAALSKQ